MPYKRCLDQLKSARAAAVQACKKRKSEASSVLNTVHLKVEDDKLSTTDTSNTEGGSGTWFWNESANESDSDTEEEEDKDEDEGEGSEDVGERDDNQLDQEEGESRTQKAVSLWWRNRITLLTFQQFSTFSPTTQQPPTIDDK